MKLYNKKTKFRITSYIGIGVIVFSYLFNTSMLLEILEWPFSRIASSVSWEHVTWWGIAMVIIAKLAIITPPLSLILSCFINRKIFYIIFSIINIVGIPIFTYFLLLPPT